MSEPSSSSEAEAQAAEWALQLELRGPFPIWGAVGVAALCVASLILWTALIWAIVSAL